MGTVKLAAMLDAGTRRDFLSLRRKLERLERHKTPTTNMLSRKVEAAR